MSDEVKEFVELTQDIVSKGLDRHLYLQEQEFLVRSLLVDTGVGIEGLNRTTQMKLCHRGTVVPMMTSKVTFTPRVSVNAEKMLQ